MSKIINLLKICIHNWCLNKEMNVWHSIKFALSIVDRLIDFRKNSRSHRLDTPCPLFILAQSREKLKSSLFQLFETIYQMINHVQFSDFMKEQHFRFQRKHLYRQSAQFIVVKAVDTVLRINLSNANLVIKATLAVRGGKRWIVKEYELFLKPSNQYDYVLKDC